MKLSEIFNRGLGERQEYEASEFSEEILLPITKDGFECLLEIAAHAINVPLDDKLRSVFAGYVHHIGNEKNTITIEQICSVLHKSISNQLTWEIDQQIKEKNREEQKQKLSIVPTEDTKVIQ